MGLKLQTAIFTLTSICLFLWFPEIREVGVSNSVSSHSASAQFFRPQDVGNKVYERLPDLPLENQYINAETGEVDADNTLADRLVKYHLYVKNRPPNYRFDWKLTMSDYLGAHDYLEEAVYPGNNSLQENPLDGDRAVIENLTRKQRDALVEVLVSIFNPNRSNLETPVPEASPAAPTTNSNPRRGPLPAEPGDAQLLKP
ncbi:MAG: hypothetical protein F6K58_27665 [Symploca sp. SIO2E9]|nr:hypothetical protein [Symploca sp. SIO2E9]